MPLSLSGGDAAAKLAALHKSQAVIEFNMDGTIITANAEFPEDARLSLEETKGKHHSLFVEPAYEAARNRKLLATLGTANFRPKGSSAIAKGGREVWIEATYNPILDRNGKPYKVVKFATDITRQKRPRPICMARSMRSIGRRR